jgi:hypothetical protein
VCDTLQGKPTPSLMVVCSQKGKEGKVCVRVENRVWVRVWCGLHALLK